MGRRAIRRRGRTVEGDFTGGGFRFALVAARFNELIVDQLVRGCENTLARHGVPPDAITLYHVPGAFELAVTAREIARKNAADAVICLGCVIRGGTDHYEHITRETARGIAEVGRRTGVPTIFGVLTCDTLEQAVERAGTKMGNAGRNAAMAALEMASLLGKI